LSNLEKNTNFQSLFGIVTITIAMMLIIGSSFPDISLGKSSSLIASSSGGGVSTGNSGSNVSNLHGIHNQSSSNHLYFAPPPSPALGINIISNKLVMIGFDDSYKSQILYAKPILDKYGF
jgi:hypothetical protein